MKLKEIAIGSAHRIDLDTSIADAVEIMENTDSNCLVVMQDDRVVGVLTVRNVAVGCVLEMHESWRCKAYRHMTLQNETAHPEMDIADANEIMDRIGAQHLPVMNNKVLVGMLSRCHTDHAVAIPAPAISSDRLVTAGY